MLSFLYLWGYCWKCELDYRCQNRIENYYHHDGEQLLFKKIYIKTQSKKKDVFVIILLQETKNSNLYNQNCTQNVKNRTSNAIFNMKKVDLDES